MSCLALHLSWTFLVKFNDKTHPEKQQIDLSFMAGSGPPLIDRDTPIVIVHGINAGHIAYRISHTARTWGSDIDALLTAHLKTLVDDIPKSRKWLAENDGVLAVFVFCFMIASALIAVVVATSRFLQKQQDAVALLPATASQAGISSEYLQYLVDVVASGQWERYLLLSSAFLLLSLVVSLLVAVWAGATADNLPPSFLLLTKESEKRRRKILAKRENKWRSFISSVLVGVVIGVAGNVSYALWFQKLVEP